MAKKIRVYELARELGLTNKEALDLSISMGIGVKSHSSSIEDQQADRVRRKADREGLRRDVQPKEDEPASSQSVSPLAAGPSPANQLPTGEAPPVLTGPSTKVAAAEQSAPSTTSPPVSPGQSVIPAPSIAAPSVAAASSQPASLQPASPAPPAAPAHAAGQASTEIPPPPAGAGPTGRPVQQTTTAPGVSARPPRAPSPPPLARPASGSDLTPPRTPPTRPGGARPSSAAAPMPAERPSAEGPAAGRPIAERTSAEAGPGGDLANQPTQQPATPSVPMTPAASASTRPVPPRPGVDGRSAPAGPRPTGGRPPAVGAGPVPAPGTGVTAPDATRLPSPGPTGPSGAAAPGGARAPGNEAGPDGPVAPGTPPVSSSGKPIPPPPGLRRPPMSQSGKPIPPPPGRPGGRPAPGAGRPAGAGSGRPAPSGAGASRPGGFSGPRSAPGVGGGFARPGGGTRGGPGGAPGAGGGPGGRSGPPFGGRGRAGGRRPGRRRRRNIEELEAQELTTYTPSHAPVPEGEVIVERGSTAQELGPKLNRSGADVVRFLFQQGEMVTTTQSLSDDMIELFAAEVNASVRLVDPGEEKEAELQAKYFDDEEEDDDLLRPRPPVVTVMGHVDHGKTMLLDRIRQTNVVAGEAGGITQHIGAYQVVYNEQTITFIDTPGHEAFTAMRARGAEVTDIVVLVVAADDGVMPQTIEALNHAKAADVPIIVAINKIDRDDADPNRVMQQLSELGLVPETWGGDTIMVELSALQDFGVDDLLEQVLVVAELEELVANPEGRARGIVLEANLDAGKGPVATVIIQNGTLRVSDPLVAGAAWGRVKALIDDKGDNVKEALPSMPVQVLGFDIVPAAGDELRVTEKSKTARDIAEQREQRYRAADQRRTSSATGTGAKLEDIFEQIQRGETATLNLVLKADMQGSLEAVTESLRKLERDEVKLSFVHRAVGGITENDVTLAAASNATIIGFNVRPDRGARDLAQANDVEIRAYEIIYKLIEDIESAMVGMLAPEYEEVITGEAEVREIFRVPRVGAIAGCYVRSGVITRGSKVRFLRDGVIIWKGAITSLRRFKDDVREVHENFECGIGLTNNQDLREGDLIETFEEREIPRT